MSTIERTDKQPWEGRVVDVAIVGLGPVGQTLAAELGKLGHDVVGVERWPTLFPLPRAGHIDHEIMRIMQSLSIGGEIAGDAWEMKTFVLIGANGEVINEFIREYEGISGWHSGYSMYQPHLEGLLEESACSHSNVEEVRNWQVERVTQEDDHTTLLMQHGAGVDGTWVPGEAQSELRARYVVGCDGFSSVVRQDSDITMTDFGFEDDWLVVFAEPQARNDLVPMPDGAQIWDPERPTFALRASGKRFCRWEFKLMPGETVEEMSEPEVAWDLISKWGLHPGNARLIRNSVFRLRSLIADSFGSGRAFVAGDAAHVMPPFLGQGLCSGVRDVTNLSWKLDLVLRGIASPALLESYDTERRPHSETVVQNSLFMAEMISVIDPEDAAQRDQRLVAGDIVLPSPSPPALNDGILLRDGDGAVLEPAGQLSMQPRVQIGDQTGLLDDLIGVGWAVLASGFDPAASLGPEERELARTLDIRFVRVEKSAGENVAVDESGAFADWLEELGVDAVIVRPDFYIFAGVRGADQVGEALGDLRSQLHLNPVSERASAR